MKPFLEILKKQPSTETRLYLLNYVARSLFDGLDYTTLFTLLDDKGYKRAKLEYDPSTTLYARDLDLGRKAAAAESWEMGEQINHLPHLWRYSLIRCSLTSRVNTYPDAAFLLLLRLGHQKQAERSAELLTSPAQRARVLSLIGSEYALQSGQADQSVRLFEQAYASAQLVVDKTERNSTLSDLGQACIQGSQFSLARRVVMSIEDSTKRTEGLQALNQALAQMGQWEPAREVIALLEDNKERNTALKALAQALVRFGKWQLAWEIFSTIEDSAEKVQELSAFGTVVAQANNLQTALQIWREALRVLLSKVENVSAAGDLAKAVLNTRGQEAIYLWHELREASISIEMPMARDLALYGLCQSLLQVNEWSQAMELISTMQTLIVWIKALSDSGQALITLSEELGQTGKEEEAAGIRNLAAQFWHGTREAIAAMEPSWQKAIALPTFVESLIQAHQEQEALQVWHESRDMLLTMGNPEVLIHLSCLLAQVCHEQEALDISRTIEEALEILSTVEDSEKRERKYAEVLKVLLATQQWQIARNVSRTILRSHGKGWGFKETYQVLIQAREWRQVLEVIEDMRQEEREQARRWQQAMGMSEEREPWESHTVDDANVLQELCKVLAQAKDTQEAAQLWQEMQSIFATIPTRDDDLVNAELRELVKVLAQNEQWQAALDIVRSIHGYTERSVAAREFCQLLSKAHRWQEARKIIVISIRKDSEQARALSELGLELVATGQRQEADEAWQAMQQVLAQTTSFWQYSQALRYLSLGLGQSRQWEDAQQIIHKIGDDEEAAIAMGELSRELVLLGEDNLAATAWQTARSIAATITSPNWRAHALSEMGLAMAQARHEQEASQAWQEAQEAIASIEDSYWKGRQTNELARKMLQTAQWREGLYVFKSGSADIKDEFRKLGIRLIQANQLQEAYEVQKVLAAMPSASWHADKLASELSRVFIQQDNFQEGREVLDSITDISQRIQALSVLGLAMVRAHRKPESQQIWQEIRDLITVEEKPALFRRNPVCQKAEGLSILAQAMAQANDGQEALQVWQEARELIRTLTDSLSQAEELSKIGQAMAQVGHEQEAFQVWQEAQSIIATSKEYSEKVRALSCLGQAMAQANLKQKTWEVWQEALAIITSTDERIVDILTSFEETVVDKQPDAATREDSLKGARAMRKEFQQLAQEYQGKQWQEKHDATAEAFDAIISWSAGPEELERRNMQNAGQRLGAFRIGCAFNSVSPEALSRFSQVLAEAEHWQEAREVLMTIEDQSYWQDDAWEALARSLTRAEHWQEACDAATSIKDSWKRISMQNEIVKMLAQKKQWQLAWKTLATIEDADKRTEALRELSSAIMQFYNEVHQEVAFVYRNPIPEQDMSPEQERQRTDVWHYDEYLQLFTLLLQVWTAVTTSEEALAAFPLAHGFVQRGPELGKALAQSFTWVADFLQSEFTWVADFLQYSYE